MKVIICPQCKSEIAVDNILNYDVDCDCGKVLQPVLNAFSHGAMKMENEKFIQEIKDGKDTLKVKDEMKGGLKE